jgi:serine phosphatase RsbU (regulator of sigma subunit)
LLKKLFLIGCSVLFGQQIFAQSDIQHLIDSVSMLSKTAKEDTNKVLLLSELSYRFRNNNADTAIFFANQALTLSEKLNYQRGKGIAIHDLAAAYFFRDEYGKGLEYCNQAQELLKGTRKANEKWILGMIKNTLGRIYLAKNNFPKALAYLLEALTIREEINDKLGIAQSEYYIAMVYFNQGNNEQALIYHLKALKVREEENDKEGMGQSYNSIGAIYRKLQDYPKAFEYHDKALQIDESLGNEYGIAYDIASIASVYNRQKNYEKTLEYHQKALAIREKIKDNQGIIYGLNRIAEVYQKLNKIKESNEFANRAFLLSQKLQVPRETQEAAIILSSNYEKLKNIPKAYEFQKIVLALKDSLFNIDKEKEIANLQSNYDLEKKQDEIDILNRDNLIQEEALKIKELYNYLYIGGLVLLGMIATFLIRNNRKEHRVNLLLNQQKRAIDERNEELKQTNEELTATLELAENRQKEIEKKNEDITASILYAKRIQSAVLPFSEVISESLGQEQFFILYKPRDIVSGDFYWFAEIEDELNNQKKIIFAVADCTGHGVPGAFMSMIGNELLNEIVIEKNISSPDLILNYLHKRIRYVLKQGQSDSKDGMDISICVINKQNQTIEFAGANNPMYWIYDHHLNDLKADKLPIGGEERHKERIYTKHTLPLLPNSTIYLFSDGFQDQFGGAEDKKFMVKHFRNLLFSIHQEDMPTQKAILDKTIIEWIGNGTQTDDITVVGIRM